jgi:nitronate monooxygenase
VTAAGGFGFIGAGFDSSTTLKENFQTMRTLLKVPAGRPVPVGVGVIGWIAEMTETSDDHRIPTILAEMPAAIWFAFGVDLGKYIRQVREYDSKRAHKTLVFVIVNSVADALRAANEWKVDVLVAQGIEAGGHGGSESPPMFTLVQAMVAAIPYGPPILAAGSVATGAQVASLLTLGASGVVLGTRFLYTSECQYTPAMKNALIKANFNSTTRTLAFDEVGRTNGWPAKHNGRAIANAIMDDVAQGLDLEQRMQKFDESKAQGDDQRLVIWAGVGVGHTNTIKGAADVLRELHEEAVKTLKTASSLIGPSPGYTNVSSMVQSWTNGLPKKVVAPPSPYRPLVGPAR